MTKLRPKESEILEIPLTAHEGDALGISEVQFIRFSGVTSLTTVEEFRDGLSAVLQGFGINWDSLEVKIRWAIEYDFSQHHESHTGE